MTNQDAMDIMYSEGRRQALVLQETSPEMSGTELNAAKAVIPDFQAAKKKQNMLTRPAGENGFVCKSSAGRVVKLLQPYDSEIYPQEPEDLPAQWGFKWSKDPAYALPFVAIATSPYNIDECCTEGNEVFSSTIDGNVWPPSAYPQGWKSRGVKS